MAVVTAGEIALTRILPVLSLPGTGLFSPAVFYPAGGGGAKSAGHYGHKKLPGTCPHFYLVHAAGDIITAHWPVFLASGAIIAAHWPVFLASGAVGVAAGYLSSLIIKLSGATTLKVLAAVRGPLLVLSGVVLLSETVRAATVLLFSF
eukprot:1155006-Pelagomonas_calceolata.AAC.5